MRKFILLAILVLCFSWVSAVAETKRPYRVGEKWVYEHQGPKVEGWRFVWDLNPFECEQTREVISVKKNGEKNNWVIKESYNPKSPRYVHHYIDDDHYMVKTVTFSEMVQQKAINEPGYPFDYATLKIGEEKEFKSQITGGPFYENYPVIVNFKRLEDQTVEVPAGKYFDCRHFKINVSYTVTWPEETTIWTETSVNKDIDMWYHPEVNGIVKKITRSGPFEHFAEIRDGYTVTSVLKSYTKGK